MIANFMIFVDKNNQGSSFSSSAHGWVGARTRIEFSATKIKKPFRLREGAAGGGGEGEESRRARALGWEAARLCASREAKPAKIDSLMEKIFCARPLKEKEIFSGFAGRRQAASRWGGFLPVRAEILAQSRFALRSVIATNRDILKIGKDWIARSPRLRRGSLRKNPFVWRLNQTAGEARRGLVWQAGGGSFQFFPQMI
jgi:hypothetical protein